MNNRDGYIMGIVCIIFFVAIVILGFMAINMHTKLRKEEKSQLTEEQYCLKHYREVQMRNLPAYCVKYFNAR